MIEQCVLKFGPHPGGPVLRFNPGPLTVFVGPNNSGKSMALRELDPSRRGNLGAINIVGSILPRKFDVGEVEALLNARKLQPTSGVEGQEQFVAGRVELADEPGARQTIQFHPGMRSQYSNEAFVLRVVGLYTVALDGTTRLTLTNARQLTSLYGAPTNFVSALLADPVSRARFRRLCFEAFQEYCVLDITTTPGQAQFKMSREEPPSEGEQHFTGAQATFNRAARRLDQYSDGVRAYLGLLAAVLSTDFRVMLIDEPDAFLHPPLARRLGERLSQLASERDGNVFVATHSADFLMGAIQADAQINVVRLAFDGNEATAKALAPDTMRALMRDPFLRSTAPLSALFYQAAVVCEGPIDVAFYREINYRLRGIKAGVEDCTFLLAYTKDGIRRIIGPLREMGVPAAAIVDLDIVKGTDLKRLCHAAGVPQSSIDSWGVWKGQIEAAFKRAGRDPKEGVSVLPPSEQESVRSFLAALADYGIFVVPVGIVERWLCSLGITGLRGEWLARMFDAMGSRPDAPSYVQASGDDVWAFVRRVAGWTANPNRPGMP